VRFVVPPIAPPGIVVYNRIRGKDTFMNRTLKGLLWRILPRGIQRRIRRHRHGVAVTDIEAAWEYKRAFFWNAFKALEFNGIDGDYAEFGSYSGMTFRLAYDQIRRRKIRRHLWAFVSFQGLPAPSSPVDDHPQRKKGSMATSLEEFRRICRAHGIPAEAYSVVPGFYEETLTRLAPDAAPTNIALAYIDCDMYASTKIVLKFLEPRLKHGMILAFDDFFCWTADQISGEKRALLETLGGSRKWRLRRYRDYGWAGVAFAVESADGTVDRSEAIEFEPNP